MGDLLQQVAHKEKRVSPLDGSSGDVGFLYTFHIIIITIKAITGTDFLCLVHLLFFPLSSFCDGLRCCWMDEVFVMRDGGDKSTQTSSVAHEAGFFMKSTVHMTGL